MYPTDFMKLILSYETDESRLGEITEKLNSDEGTEYLYGTNGIFCNSSNSLELSLIKNLKIKRILFEHIRSEDEVFMHVLLNCAVYYQDYEITKFMIDKFLYWMNLDDEENCSSIFLTAFGTGNPKIINLFLDLHVHQNILRSPEDSEETIYERTFLELAPKERDVAIETLMKHQYYGLIILEQTIQYSP